MRFALVNGEKREAKPELKGICPNCESEMIPKCGKIKIWHWAHKGQPPCDPWWESETDWHRNWKNNFPKEWQEVTHIDEQSGEKHIADVKNPFGLILEFQHSPLKFEERIAREKFYDNLIWIVDGIDNKPYFNISISSKPIQDKPLVYKINWYGRSKIFHNWIDSNARVYIDFGEDVLWRLLLFDKRKKVGALGPIHKYMFIEDCLTGTEISALRSDK
ncbi:competence protein CoiA [Gracilimonas tropica]|uniref:competence protein CoiA n=1 Tax=Gracilimonas tropica TaxID=454600 RepID=UPI000368F20F|nr:competence protein CoiA family protein [Gracilimonas tropica]